MKMYSAKLAPVNKPYVVRLEGGPSARQGLRKVQLDEFCLPLASRAKVRFEHGDFDIGQAAAVICHRGWWVGDFSLDPNVIDAETAALIKPGVAVSMGIDIIRSRSARRSPPSFPPRCWA